MECPLNETQWKQRSLEFGCQNVDVYHCVLLEDKTDVKEICMERSLLTKGKCPVLTYKGYRHWMDCNIPGCPDTFYASNETYKYPICLKKTNAPESHSHYSKQLYVGLGVGITLFLLLLVACIWLYIIFRWRKRNADLLDIEGKRCLIELEDNTVVEDVLSALRKEKIYLISGRLGNGVSTTAKTAIKRFLDENHVWNHHFVNYRDVPSLSISEKTIIFVDGWFGLWNENPCEEDVVKQTLQSLQLQVETFQDLKVVLGVREDIYKKYKKIFENVLPERCRLDLQISRVSRDEELESHFQSTFANTHKYEEVGYHLIIDIIDRNRRLFAKYLECKNLLKTLVSHFDDLHKKKTMLFECLMYIVIQGKHKHDDIVNEDVKDHFGFSITTDSFKKCESLQKYTKYMKGAQLVNVHGEDMKHHSETLYLVFRHVFLYLAAFHSLFRKYPKKTMKYCNINAILQIVRPEDEGDTIKFCIKADNEAVKFFYKEVVKQTPGLEDAIKDHPLVKHAIGTEV
uniref:Uncharacterized protein LOC111104227 isoform X2 n=1 Tax=Crassostrea virginica TaxID=6565 RepID=A0A8B8ASZ1_CRAVI|nr:uncharacterized protein LOC111104227 isoform X2 [Crassostrea virginica]